MKSPAAVFDVYAILDAMRIMMCPVNQTTQIDPLEHTSNSNPVSQSDLDTLCKVNVVSDQDGLTITQIGHEALMPRAIHAIRQQALHETRLNWTLSPAPIE